MIKLEHVTCKYDKVILEDISTTIKEGKITFIISRNGKGKTTLANTIAGLNKHYTGNIYIDDEKITSKTNIQTLRKKIGIVFQNPANQIIFNRVYDDIKFTLDNMHTPASTIDAIIKEALQITKMSEFINANPYNLSGGEKQRIAIASLLALKPKYLIFDEATSMLDITGKKDIYDLIEKLKHQKMGIIFITNILEELIYADEIIIIDNRKLHFYTKEELFDNLEILTKYGLYVPFNLKVISALRKKGFNSYDEEEILKELNLQ